MGRKKDRYPDWSKFPFFEPNKWWDEHDTARRAFVNSWGTHSCGNDPATGTTLPLGSDIYRMKQSGVYADMNTFVSFENAVESVKSEVNERLLRIAEKHCEKVRLDSQFEKEKAIAIIPEEAGEKDIEIIEEEG